MRFARGALTQPSADAEGWVRVETVAGSWRIGKVVEQGPSHVVLRPCFYITPDRMVVPMPHPGAGLGATFIDFSQEPQVWGDGTEERIAYAAVRKIEANFAQQLLKAVGR